MSGDGETIEGCRHERAVRTRSPRVQGFICPDCNALFRKRTPVSTLDQIGRWDPDAGDRVFQLLSEALELVAHVQPDGASENARSLALAELTRRVRAAARALTEARS